MINIYPSLMAANVLNLANEIKKLEPYCNGFHVDIMDNHFVPNLTFGIDTTNAIAQATKKQLWVHLMIERPEKMLPLLKLARKSIVSVHYEGMHNKTIQMIKDHGWLASIALRPATSPDDITNLLPTIDQVLIMSVDPGFGGQIFLDSVVDKIEPLIAYRKKHNLSFTLGMDGGIDSENIEMLAQKGVQDFSIGSAIFKHKDPIAMLKSLQNLA